MQFREKPGLPDMPDQAACANASHDCSTGWVQEVVMHEAMLRKLKQNRKRVLIRAWEMRQLDHAKGVWYRMRYLLAMAEHIYAISPDQADSLASAGYAELAVGLELSPRKRLFSVPRSELNEELTVHPLTPRLSTAVLGARNLVLVPWEWAGASSLAGG